MTAVYVPPLLTLSVRSVNPTSGATVSLNPGDHNGVVSGVTPFSVSYDQMSVVSMTASATVGGNTFSKWQQDGVDFGSGRTVQVTVDKAHTLTAVYQSPPSYTFTIRSSGPSGTVTISVSPRDLNRQGSGSTPLSRTYSAGTAVSLSAPQIVGSYRFQKWQRDGVDLSTSNAITTTADANRTFQAVYIRR